MCSKVKLACLLAAFLGSPAGWAQDDPEIPTGRWVRQGTYALSGYAQNPNRDRTYAGAGKERNRILSYLPAMTIVFPDFVGLIKDSTPMPGYTPGITQTGTPVIVLDRELSRGRLGASENQDVVIHAEHDACSSPYCDLATEGQPVGIGHSYKIADDSTEDLIHLANPASETDLYYRKEKFDEAERLGTLTRLKGRVIPRWDIREGYADKLSVSCGEFIPEGAEFKVDAEAFESSPATWDMNGDQWTVKAAQLFVGSHVEKTSDGTYTATIRKRIHDVTKPPAAGDDYKSAIDFTVFAYLDRNNRDAGYKFAVLISIVACTSDVFGNLTPDYAREAHLYFDDAPYKLPQQVSEEGKKLLSKKIDRSFMYSVNTSVQHRRLFDRLASELSLGESDTRSNLVAVVMSRLNATCDGNDRSGCAQIVNANPAPAEVAGQ